jgi:hypothetical protein
MVVTVHVHGEYIIGRGDWEGGLGGGRGSVCSAHAQVFSKDISTPWQMDKAQSVRQGFYFQD